MNQQTHEVVLKNIDLLKTKALERLEHLNKCQALTPEVSAGVIMADITDELAKGYSDIHKLKSFKMLKQY